MPFLAGHKKPCAPQTRHSNADHGVCERHLSCITELNAGKGIMLSDGNTEWQFSTTYTMTWSVFVEATITRA